MNPKPFLQLDRVIHEKGRMAIMSLLAAAPEMSFTDLRDTLQLTDGNLTTHIKKLQQAGYVGVTKTIAKKRPLTTVSLTKVGQKAFSDYLGLLEQIVHETKKSK